MFVKRRRIIISLISISILCGVVGCRSKQSTPPRSRPGDQETVTDRRGRQKNEDGKLSASSTIDQDSTEKTELAADPLEILTIPGIEPVEIHIPELSIAEFTAEPAYTQKFEGEISTEKQVDVYEITLPLNGYYRFDITELQRGTQVSIYLLDSTRKILASVPFCGNDGGLTFRALGSEEKITIQIEQKVSYGAYVLSVGYQKALVEIDEYTLINDSIEFTDQLNCYNFIPPRYGRYRFELSGMRSGIVTCLYATNALGEILESDKYASNGRGITLQNLNADETYQICVGQNDNFGQYALSVGYQKEIVDITEYTSIHDRLEYKDQRNVYLFTPSQDGVYRFELSGMQSGTVAVLNAYNNLGESFALNDRCANGDGITLEDLKAGEQYEIQVRQRESFSSYILNFGWQKEPKDISDFDGVNDSVQYIGQRNVYTFIPAENRTYTFTMLNMLGECEVDLQCFDILRASVASDTSCTNGESITVFDMTAGETYEIQVGQKVSTSEYILRID